jgi:hypothetical protein
MSDAIEFILALLLSVWGVFSFVFALVAPRNCDDVEDLRVWCLIQGALHMAMSHYLTLKVPTPRWWLFLYAIVYLNCIVFGCIAVSMYGNSAENKKCGFFIYCFISNTISVFLWLMAFIIFVFYELLPPQIQDVPTYEVAADVHPQRQISQQRSLV